jgi:hypothetical protein
LALCEFVAIHLFVCTEHQSNLCCIAQIYPRHLGFDRDAHIFVRRSPAKYLSKDRDTATQKLSDQKAEAIHECQDSLEILNRMLNTIRQYTRHRILPVFGHFICRNRSHETQIKFQSETSHVVSCGLTAESAHFQTVSRFIDKKAAFPILAPCREQL